MTNHLITRIGAENLATIMPVMKSAFDARFGEAWTEAQCLGVMAMPGSALIVIGDTTVCGFALSRTIIDECELMLLAVLPEYRGRGYGRTLLDAVVANALESKATAIFLEARDGNPAISLYSAAGFKEVGRRRHYYRGSCGEIFDALTLRLAMS